MSSAISSSSIIYLHVLFLLLFILYYLYIIIYTILYYYLFLFIVLSLVYSFEHIEHLNIPQELTAQQAKIPVYAFMFC